MNSREIQELQELYSEVYIVEEKSGSPKPTFIPKSRERNIGKHDDWKDKPSTEWGEKSPAAKKLTSRLTAVVGTQRRQDKETGVREEFDIFDFILEHLVAEGYADTNEAALAIMTNMSEDWRESILDEGYKEIDREKHGRMYNRYKKLRTAAMKDAQETGEASGDNRYKMGKMSNVIDKSAENLRNKG